MYHLRRQVLPRLVGTVLLTACGGVVDVAQMTSSGHAATNASDIEIIRTRPARDFEELGTVTASRFRVDDVGEMHNALRSKSAPLGANAVLILEERVMYRGSGYFERSATGIAIRYR